jgi:hypothetical protein
VLLLALVSLPGAAAAESRQLAMTTHVPRGASVAAVNSHAGEAGDLCAPGEELRRDARGWLCASRARIAVEPGLETYQTFEMASASPGAPARFVTACLAPEDRVIGGTCVRKDRTGYRFFDASPATAGGADGIECALDGAEAASAVAIAVCLDVPPTR